MDTLLVDKYLSKVSVPNRSELERVRLIVKKVAPEATEVISYGMPGFKYKGQYMLGYAAFKDHLSLFPTSVPIELLRGELTEYKTAKGTIQFSADNPISEALITKIVKLRLKNILSKDN